MGKDFKPRSGQITLSSIIGRGIIHELACADSGVITVQSNMEPCEVGLYTVAISSHGAVKEIPVLVGTTVSGRILTQDECQQVLNLPVVKFTEDTRQAPHWLKGIDSSHALDRLVPTDELIARQSEKLSPAQAEEIEKMTLRAKTGKATLVHVISDLETKVQKAESELETVSGDRLKKLALEKQANKLRQELMKRQENQFFDAMRLDMEREEQIKTFTEKEKLTAKITREFVVKVEGSL